MDKKKGLINLGVIIVLFISIIVCFFGYRTYKNKQYQQRVEYAQSMADRSNTSLVEVEEAINNLFTDDNQTFLKKEIEESDITALESNLNRIGTSAKDFDIKEADMPTELLEVDGTRENLKQTLVLAKKKLALQSQVNSLFTKELKDWQADYSELAVKTDIVAEQVSDMKDDIALIAKDAWQERTMAILTHAQDQIQTKQDIEASIAELMVDGELTATADYTAYYNLTAKIDTVLNSDWKTDFEEQASEIATLLGGATTSYTPDYQEPSTDTGYTEYSEYTGY